MEQFQLDKAKGFIKKCTTAKTKSKDEGKSVLTNDVHLLVVVDKRCSDAVDYAFPGYADVENAVAGREGHHKGLEMQAKADVPELNVTVFDGTGTAEVFKFERIGFNGKLKIMVNSLGDSHMVMRLNARLGKKDMSKLVDYVDADIYVSAEIAEPLLPGIATANKVSEAIEATEPVTRAAQQNLDGSMPGEDLMSFRESEGMTISEMVEWFGEREVSVSAKSLRRYETGLRTVPDMIAQAVNEAFAV